MSGDPVLDAPGRAPLRGVPRHRHSARAVALACGVALLLPALGGCTGGEAPPDGSGAGQAVATASRAELARGGAVRWGVDRLPATLNAFQADSDAVTDRVAEAVLPRMFTLDAAGRPQPHEDYLRAVEVTEEEPEQRVVYTLHPEARWSDGRRLDAADFAAQWRALNGSDRSYVTARDLGYDRITRVAEGPEPHQVEVTFARPYADWQALFNPLYPRSVTADPDAFNDGARTELPISAGPFAVAGRDREAGTLTLERDPSWWGDPALLDRLVLTAVPPGEREAALLAGELDVAAVPTDLANRISAAGDATPDGGGAPLADQLVEPPAGPPAGGPSAAVPEAATRATAGRPAALRALHDAGRARLAAAQDAEPGTAPDPDADADADTRTGTDTAPDPDAEPADPAAAAPDTDADAAADGTAGDATARADAEHLRALEAAARARGSAFAARERSATAALAGYSVHRAFAAGYTQLTLNGAGDALADPRVRRAVAGALDREELARLVHEPAGLPTQPLGNHLHTRDQAGYADHSEALGESGARAAGEQLDAAGWRAPGSAAAPPAAGPQAAGPQAAGQHGRPAAVRSKDGAALTLRFLLPAGPGTEPLRTVGHRVADMLAEAGVETDITEVDDASAFREHVVAGDFDLALYSWPATAFPASAARPVFGKPQPIPGDELVVEQNYSRVGTDRIDQLLDQAVAELDEGERHALLAEADERLWAAAGSIPLFQHPELVAARSDLAGVGAFGLQTPRYQDIGYRR